MPNDQPTEVSTRGFKRRQAFIDGLEGLEPEDVPLLHAALTEKGRREDTASGERIRPAVNQTAAVRRFLDMAREGEARKFRRKGAAKAAVDASAPGRKVARKAKAANPGKALKGGGKAKSSRRVRIYG